MFYELAHSLRLSADTGLMTLDLYGRITIPPIHSIGPAASNGIVFVVPSTKGKFLHITLAALHACIYYWDNRLFDLLFCSVLCVSVSSGNELCCDVKQKWISPPEGREIFGVFSVTKVRDAPTYLPTLRPSVTKRDAADRPTYLPWKSPKSALRILGMIP